MTALRDYQDRARLAVAAEYRAGHRRPLLVSPVGSGKTAMGVAICEGALRKGRRVVWCADRVELVGQARARILAVGVDSRFVGVVQAGQRAAERRDAPIQVCSVQTLVARGAAPPADIIVLDEAHHAVATTWRAIVSAYPGLEMLLGLTATPERGDGAGLGDVFDALVEASTVEELTALGHLVPADVIAPAEYRDKLAMSPVDAWRRYCPGALTVAFCRDVQHAADTAREFRAAGVAAAHLSGTTPKDERERILADLASGALRVVTNVDVLTEGWDLPALECVLLACRIGTWGRWMQTAGRGLRASPETGKERCTVLDPYGNVHRHGLLADRRVFSLSGGSSAAPQGIPVRQCARCGAAYRSADCCPRCGYRAPPLPAPRVQRAEMAKVPAVPAASAEHKRACLAKWTAEAAAKGWKPQAVGIRFQRVFGHWPTRI